MVKNFSWRNASKAVLLIIAGLSYAYSKAGDYFLVPSLREWKTGGDLFAAAVFVVVVFWHLMDKQREIDLRQSKIEAIQNTKPIIKVKKAYSDLRDVMITTITKREGDLIGYSTETGSFSRLFMYEGQETFAGTVGYRQFPYESERIETCRFAHVMFFNEPKEQFEYATAEKVWAELAFYNDKKELIWEDINGRWSETGQPIHKSPFQIKRDLLEVDFPPNQLGWELDIAMRNVKERIGYVFNNDSYDFVEFKRSDMSLLDDKYFVKVILRGVRLKSNGEEFCFLLHNGEEIDDFTIEEIGCF